MGDASARAFPFSFSFFFPTLFLLLFFLRHNLEQVSKKNKKLRENFICSDIDKSGYGEILAGENSGFFSNHRCPNQGTIYKDLYDKLKKKNAKARS